jgi:hypothetical protein
MKKSDAAAQARTVRFAAVSDRIVIPLAAHHPASAIDPQVAVYGHV